MGLLPDHLSLQKLQKITTVIKYLLLYSPTMLRLALAILQPSQVNHF